MNDAFTSLLSIAVAAVVFSFAFTAAERVFGGGLRKRKTKTK
jgi:hypothetical protein